MESKILLAAVILFIISVVVFMYRISKHDVLGEAFYTPDEDLVYSQRKREAAGVITQEQQENDYINPTECGKNSYYKGW